MKDAEATPAPNSDIRIDDDQSRARTTMTTMPSGGRLAASVNAFVALAEAAPDHQTTHHAVITGVHDLCLAVRAAEMDGWSREAILETVGPARELQARSPFVRRLQTWPRGYPGDFETIEYLCEARNHATPDTVGFFIEQYMLLSGPAQQHRNKIAWQAERILDTCLRRKSDTRVLSIACGGSRDLLSIRPMLDTLTPRIWLNDMDEDALALSSSRLPSLAVEAIRGNFFRTAAAIARSGPFDIIVAGGLFDYLTDAQITWLVSRLLGTLAPGGRLCFTNIARGNPYRVWLEYSADWTLLERSEDEVRALVAAAARGGTTTTAVTRDPTGLTLLVEVTRQGSFS